MRGRSPHRGRTALAFVATCLAAILLAPTVGAGEGGKPARIVSLNLCTDELLLRLADRDRIASVTWLAQSPLNANMTGLAAEVPVNHGLAEEVLAARPDLVVVGRYTTRTTVALLRRAGLRIVEFGVPGNLAETFAQIRTFADAIGEPARGDAVVAEMQHRLAAIEAPAEPRPRALVLRPNGFTAGRGSLVDDILVRAGLDNLAARLDLGDYAQVPLETMVLERADLLVLDATRDGPPSLATEVLHHPVVARLAGRLTLASVPSRLWTCAGPSVVEAIERLHAFARAAAARTGSP